MLGLVNGKSLGDAVRELRVGVVPTPVQFLEGNGIGPIPIDLVGGHVNERRLRAMATGGFQQVQRASRISVKVVKRNGCSAIVAWLGSGVDNGMGTQLFHQGEHSLPVPNVEFVVDESRQLLLEPLLVPTSVALRTEKHCSLV